MMEVETNPTGNYFVANYPPFSYWSADAADTALNRLHAAGDSNQPLGLYIHLPFCRKRCHFCYFRVYTEKSSSEISDYIRALGNELAHYASLPYMANRRLKYIYFGGGTPSYLGTGQLRELFAELQSHLPWDGVEEVTFECEPGTLHEQKLAAIKAMGVTRLSLGIENFDDQILQANNRAHLSRHIYSAFAAARKVGFPQINIDLIAGMVGETDANWRDNIAKVLQLAPDSVTIYQMEVPFNTALYRQLQNEGKPTSPPADWPSKRRWQAEAFAALAEAGYQTSSAYTVVKTKDKAHFVYRDSLWRGGDLIGLGVSAFGHLNGAHIQNEKDIGNYQRRVFTGELPISRAYLATVEERLIREMILQLKTGSVDSGYFQRKFGHNILEKFAKPFDELMKEDLLLINEHQVELTANGLLRVDGFLQRFFLAQHGGPGT